MNILIKKKSTFEVEQSAPMIQIFHKHTEIVLLLAIFSSVIWGSIRIMQKDKKNVSHFNGNVNHNKAMQMTKSNNSDDYEKLRSIKLVSMNIAMCQPSAEAPLNWTIETCTNTLRSELLSHDPDLIALQECPEYGSSWAEKTFSAHGYMPIGFASAHMGNVILLSKSAVTSTRVTLPTDLPAVMTRMMIQANENSVEVFITSCHLAPYLENNYLRKEQIMSILQSAKTAHNEDKSQGDSYGFVVIIAGDMNMRDSEDADIESISLQQPQKEATYSSSVIDKSNSDAMMDAWKLGTTTKKDRMMKKYTWDTVDHTQEKGGGGTFNQYYGIKTKQYQKRYDRIYIYNHNPVYESNIISNRSVVSVSDFNLIANQPIHPSKVHFLSDHFGIKATIGFNFPSIDEEGA